MFVKICYWTPNSIGGAGKYEHYLPYLVSKLNENVEIKVVRRPKGIRGNPIFLRYYYKTYDCDLVHATTQTLCIYSFPKPKKFIVTVHDIYTLHKSIKSRIKKSLIKKSLNRADRIIAVSKFTKHEIMEYIGIKGEKITVIPMGVDLSLYKPIDKYYSRKKLGLDYDKKYILIVSSNAPHKRMDIAIKVFLEVRKYMGNNVKLIKCGYGHKLEGDGIINVGFVPEYKMPFLYNAADILLHTSEYEGFGVPLLEAMSCGLHIVTSNKAAIPEVVGDCAHLIDIESDNCIQEFVNAILKVFETKKKNYKGIERSKIFSWENCAKKTYAIYEELLSNG